MELIVGYLNQGLSFVVPFIILLGLLIFVHELGHFLVAKYFGVRVEVFSLGFGKKIFSYRRGETEYCISVIPFGGYVKMFGDDPTAQIPEEQKAFSFNHKPVGQRIAVVLAGPLMNLFWAFLLFIGIAFIGEAVVHPTLGDVESSSPAYQAGFRSSDEILRINTLPIKTWDDAKEIVEDSADRNLSFTVKRKTGEEAEIKVTPKLVANKNLLSTKAYIGEIEGLVYTADASVIGVSDPTSLAAAAGFKTGDFITRVGDFPLKKWTELNEVLSGISQRAGPLEFEVERETKGKTETLKISADLSGLKKAGDSLTQQMGLEPSELFVSEVLENSAAASAGLLVGDKLLIADGRRLERWHDLVDTIRQFKDGGAPINLSVIRDGAEKSFQLVPQKVKQTSPTGKEEEHFAIGVKTSMVLAPPKTFVARTSNPIEALQIGVKQTVHWTKTTVLSFVRLIQNKVSAKSIGGPIMIGQLASETFKIGISPFLKIMAIISLNLFVLNLLPVPVLDGGHLLFFTVEAIRGAPMSLRKMEIAQQVGLVLLLSLMVFAVFNDVRRLFEFSW